MTDNSVMIELDLVSTLIMTVDASLARAARDLEDAKNEDERTVHNSELYQLGHIRGWLVDLLLPPPT